MVARIPNMDSQVLLSALQCSNRRILGSRSLMLPPAKDRLERQGRPTVKKDGLGTKSSSELSYLSWYLSITDILLLTYIETTLNIVARAVT